MMEYGYIRVSSRGQNEARQLIAMHEFGIPDQHRSGRMGGRTQRIGGSTMSIDKKVATVRCNGCMGWWHEVVSLGQFRKDVG